MKKETWIALWHRIIRWPSWRGWLKWKGWKAIGAWNGWRRLFILHPVFILFLTLLSGAGLFWAFTSGMENHWVSYLIYVLSAYTLAAASASLPKFVKHIRTAAHSNPYVQRYLSDKELRFQISLYSEQIINTFYGIFKTVSGIIHGSAWIGADGLYNLAQSLIQLIQILRRRKAQPLMQQWKSYRLCGWLILGMHLTITGLVFQMVHMGRTEEYPGYLIFVTALFAFYKLIKAFIDVAKDRKNKAPIDSSVRLLNLSQALFSIFSLQAAMIHQFDGRDEFAELMNSLTGGAVCIMIVGMGIYMLGRSRREMKKLEESWNG